MVKRGEALHDGLPRDNVVQDDQIMCGVGQMSLDPLGRERVLKCLCYHGMDLCLGCRETPFRHYPTDQRSQKHALGEKISGYYLSVRNADVLDYLGCGRHTGRSSVELRCDRLLYLAQTLMHPIAGGIVKTETLSVGYTCA